MSQRRNQLHFLSFCLLFSIAYRGPITNCGVNILKVYSFFKWRTYRQLKRPWKATSALHTKGVSLPSNKLSSFLFDLEFRRELFNNSTTIETKQRDNYKNISYKKKLKEKNSKH
jgi:hypothetical protein